MLFGLRIPCPLPIGLPAGMTLAAPAFNLNDRGRIETMGQVHVLDVSDVQNPRKVADYFVAGGAHNVWVDDDVLYIGAYEAGLRALDVSGCAALAARALEAQSAAEVRALVADARLSPGGLS